MNSSTANATLGVRLIALFFVALGLWLLVTNLLESAGSFNPAYLGYYFTSQIARPLLALVTGLLLGLFNRPLGRLLARGLS